MFTRRILIPFRALKLIIPLKDLLWVTMWVDNRIQQKIHLSSETYNILMAERQSAILKSTEVLNILSLSIFIDV